MPEEALILKRNPDADHRNLKARMLDKVDG
jgi:hypothetical protein